MRAMDFRAPSLASIAATTLSFSLVVHGDEQVALAHRSLAQHGEGRRVALDGDHVGQTAHLGEQLLVAVDDGDVVAVAAEHTGQVTAHLAGTRYYDFHSIASLSFFASAAEGQRAAFFAIYLTNVYICPRNPKFRDVKKRNPMPDMVNRFSVRHGAAGPVRTGMC